MQLCGFCGLPLAAALDIAPLLLLFVPEKLFARKRRGIGVAGGVMSQIALISIVAAELAQSVPKFSPVCTEPPTNRSEQVKRQGAAKRATKTYRGG